MTKHRIAITGIGPVTSLGIGRTIFAEALAESGSAVAEMTQFDPEGLGFSQAAEIPPFDVEDYLLSPKTYLDHNTEVAFAAARLAVKDARIDPDDLAGSPAGMLAGTAMGSMQTAEDFFSGYLEKGARFVKPLLFPNAYSNTSASMLAIEYKLQGPHLNYASGFVSGAQAVAEAFDMIRAGRCELCLVGGFDTLSEFLLEGCAKSGWAASPADSGRNNECSAPFGNNRNGFSVGEAGAMLVLESFDHARRRNANVRAELLAVSEKNAITQTDLPEAIHRAMREAAGELSPDLVLANANGSVLLDDAEAKAIMSMDVSTPVTSIKPLTGETFGAGGPLQLISALCILESGTIPSTLNTRDLAPAVELDLVRETRTDSNLKKIIANTIDPGGTVVSFAVGKGS